MADTHDSKDSSAWILAGKSFGSNDQNTINNKKKMMIDEMIFKKAKGDTL
jgi:hypothetical protein